MLLAVLSPLPPLLLLWAELVLLAGAADDPELFIL